MKDSFDIEVPNQSVDFNKYTMPFGKYKGELMEDIPNSYLEWALENLNHMDSELRETIKTRLILGQYVQDEFGN